ncbi:hypothetical protein HY570_01485 [Candidatus Micrarchaeota archaeon]|nr:hypothetical protein [Candidatus Micrarchaeota archaeon]
MVEVLLKIVGAVLLTVIGYFSEVIEHRFKKYHDIVLGFGTGSFITFIFLDLLPEAIVNEASYIYFLLGFIVFHIVKKYIFQHAIGKERKHYAVILDRGEEFIKNVTEGVTVVFSLDFAVAKSFLVFIPLILRKISFSVLLTPLHHYEGKDSNLLGIIAQAGTIVGTIMALQFSPASELFKASFPFVIGALLYMVLRDIFPKEKEGSVEFFAIGVAVTYVLIHALKTVA